MILVNFGSALHGNERRDDGLLSSHMTKRAGRGVYLVVGQIDFGLSRSRPFTFHRFFFFLTPTPSRQWLPLLSSST